VNAADDGPVTQSPDTSPEVEALQVALLRRLTPAQKWRQVCELVAAGDSLALAGLRQRHPGAGSDELRLRLAALKYERELVLAAFGWDPAQQGLQP
jgi:hypothetical protein